MLKVAQAPSTAIAVPLPLGGRLSVYPQVLMQKADTEINPYRLFDCPLAPEATASGFIFSFFFIHYKVKM
jgi:hypothetical protein